MSRLSRLLVLLVLLGAFSSPFAPPSLYAEDYLLFASTAEQTRGLIFEMDGEGYLTFREEHPVGWDAHHVVASPDARVVVVGAVSPPYLTVFFVRGDGTVVPPVYADSGYHWTYYNPIGFHASLPLFYAGISPSTVAFRYDQLAHQVQPTSQTMEAMTPWSWNLCCSGPSNCLFFQQYDSSNLLRMVQAVRLKADGDFGDLCPPYSLPTSVDLGDGYTTILGGGADFTVSPNGRWAVLPQYRDWSIGSAYLTVLAIAPDGSLSLADLSELILNEELDAFPYVIFSPDSRSLYLLSEAHKTLIAFDVNPDTGKLTQRSSLTREDFGVTLYSPVAMAISPDGRFLAFHSQLPTDAGRNYIHVVQIRDDGQLEYLPDRRIEVDARLADLAFTWRPHDAAGPQWALYE